MSSGIALYFRTERTAPDLSTALVRAIERHAGSSAGYWVNLHPSDDEDRDGCRTEYGLDPTVNGVVQPPRGAGDLIIYRALLELIDQCPSDDVVASLQGTPLLAHRNGQWYASADERELFEREVTGARPLDTSTVTPWKE